MTGESSQSRRSESDLTFEEKLILSEEMFWRKNQVEVIEESDRPFFVEMRDFTKNSPFGPRRQDDATDPSDKQDDFPIKGRGKLDNLLIIADSDQYELNVAVDDRDVVDDSYSSLSSISDELEHVSAYNRDNEFITLVTDYPFEEGLYVTIKPLESIFFYRVRAEGVTENGHGRGF